MFFLYIRNKIKDNNMRIRRISESIGDNVNITLTSNEAKLLLLLLKDLEKKRDDQGSNDPRSKEEQLFSKEERKKMARFIGWDEDEIDDMDGFLYDSDYVKYLRKKIKSLL